jgi:hypothetical protein
MATNVFKKYTESLVREWDVPAATLSGAAVLEAGSLRVGVTLTARGDVTASQTLPDGTTRSGIPAGGIGNRSTGATVAVDGSWIFTVATVANGSTAVGGAGTDKGTAVYAIVASGVITGLTLVSTDNTFFGRIDDGTIVGGKAPVQIGIS